MNRASQRRSLFLSTLLLLSLFGFLFGGFAQSASAAVNPSGTAVKPWLIGKFDDATSTNLTVMGHGFTPSGQVYLALYDQAGVKLYEHRQVVASPKLSADQAARLSDHLQADMVAGPGGEIDESFNGLCGASVMVRALDKTTNVWSDWLTVDSACAPAAEIANDINSSLKLPVAVPSAYAIATGIMGDPPVLIDATSSGADDGSIALAGFDFTAGHRVFIAVYDQMGAKLYQTRWLTASPQYTITGMSDVSPEAHPIISAEKGAFLAHFPRFCGASVMVRAYDQSTETWSNWVDFDSNCQSAGPDGSAAKIG